MPEIPAEKVVSIRPKERIEFYRKHRISLTFQPASGRWGWKFVHPAKVPFSGIGANPGAAIRMAKRQIDKLLDGE